MGGWVIFNPKRSQTVVLISVLFCFRKPRVDRKDERVLILSIYWWHGNQDVQCSADCAPDILESYWNFLQHPLSPFEMRDMRTRGHINEQLIFGKCGCFFVVVNLEAVCQPLNLASAVQFPEPTERPPKNTPTTRPINNAPWPDFFQFFKAFSWRL